jgi:hypothetical protein
MKRKVGTTIEERLYRRAKEAAQRQGRSVNDLIAEALEQTLSRSGGGASVVAETKGTYKVSPRTLRRVLEEDIYDAG